MNVKLARNIDYWLGIPLCFVINAVYRVEKFFTIALAGRPKKILFIELSEMGAAILAYSAIKKAGQLYPESELYFLIFEENAGSVRILNNIPESRIFTIRSRNIFILVLDTLRVLGRIRSKKIDVVVDLELFSRFTSILSYFSGAKIRAGFHRFSLEGLYRADIYTHKVLYNVYRHISLNFLALVCSLKQYNKDSPALEEVLSDEKPIVPRLGLDRMAAAHIWDKLRAANNKISGKSKIVVVNLGLGECFVQRKWPLENYMQLMDKLLFDEEVFIVLIGLKSEQFRSKKKFSPPIASRLIDLNGKTDLRELIDLCNISRLLISHDSGVIHLASLTPVHIIAMFGPETPVLYAPLGGNKTIFYKNIACSPCFSAYNHRLSLCRKNSCLALITVEEVYQSAWKYLKDNRTT